MTAAPEAVRVAIAGAASLRGKELKQCLEESNFPAAEIRLLDEEVVAGTLTETGGEPAIIVMGAVVANAIYDATGARLFQLPMTPERVLAAMQKA